MVTAPAPPEPLPRPALDSHTHLDMIELPVPDVLAAARAAGIVRVVTVGTDLPSSRWSARSAAEHGDVYAAVGDFYKPGFGGILDVIDSGDRVLPNEFFLRHQWA